jgi:hypothetical protein
MIGYPTASIKGVWCEVQNPHHQRTRSTHGPGN